MTVEKKEDMPMKKILAMFFSAFALAWVLIDFSYNNATGSCAKWVLYAERLGLLEAHRIVADPPEQLRGYLLPPEQQ